MQSPTPIPPGRSGLRMIVVIAVCLIGLLGAYGALYLGSKWPSDMNSIDPVALALYSKTSTTVADDLEGVRTASILLMVTGIVGAIASILLLWRCWTKMLAFILLVCGVLPLFFHKSALLGIPMALAGLIAVFLLKDKATNRTVG